MLERHVPVLDSRWTAHEVRVRLARNVPCRIHPRDIGATVGVDDDAVTVGADAKHLGELGARLDADSDHDRLCGKPSPVVEYHVADVRTALDHLHRPTQHEPHPALLVEFLGTSTDLFVQSREGTRRDLHNGHI
jgi:hypothetical protein